MPNLFPEAITQDPINDELIEDEFIGYKSATYFDGKDFARDGTHRVIMANGATAWTQWCEKCLETQKGASLYYPDWYGIDWRQVLSCGDRALAENILFREISDTLKSDSYGRLDHIESIECSWSGTSLDVTVVAVGIDGSTTTIPISKKVA